MNDKENVTCQHHWHIEEANGPTSKAECINCHNIIELHNNIPYDRIIPFRNIPNDTDRYNDYIRELECNENK
jgi:hypothetical protein